MAASINTFNSSLVMDASWLLSMSKRIVRNSSALDEINGRKKEDWVHNSIILPSLAVKCSINVSTLYLLIN